MVLRQIHKDSRITLVELPATQFGIFNGELSYDIYSRTKIPRATPLLEGILRNNGYEDVFSIDAVNYADKTGRCSRNNLMRIFGSDALLLSPITRTASPSMELADKFRGMNNRMVIAGGYDATFRAEEWARHADIVVVGEGDKTLAELMERLDEDFLDLRDIKGLVYFNGKDLVDTGDRELLKEEELSKLPTRYYSEEKKRKMSVSIAEGSRGCLHRCNFCSVWKFNQASYRIKTSDAFLDEVRNSDFGNYRFFTDDNLVASIQSIENLERITEEKLNDKYGIAQVDILTAFETRDRKTKQVLTADRKLNALWNAGVRALCVGVESINNESLKRMRKPANAEKNKEGIRIMRERGFHVHGMAIIGVGDSPESWREDLEWLKYNVDSAQFFTITPFPGTDLEIELEKEGKILTRDYSLYDAQHVVVMPDRELGFTPLSLQKTLFYSTADFYSWKTTMKRIARTPKRSWKNMAVSCGITGYATFGKGVEKVENSRQTQQHLRFLERFE